MSFVLFITDDGISFLDIMNQEFRGGNILLYSSGDPETQSNLEASTTQDIKV